MVSVEMTQLCRMKAVIVHISGLGCAPINLHQQARRPGAVLYQSVFMYGEKMGFSLIKITSFFSKNNNIGDRCRNY